MSEFIIKVFFSITFLLSFLYFFLGKLLVWNFQERFFDNSRIFFKKNYLIKINSFCTISNRISFSEKRRHCIAIILFFKELAWKRLKSAKKLNRTNLWPPCRKLGLNAQQKSSWFSERAYLKPWKSLCLQKKNSKNPMVPLKRSKQFEKKVKKWKNQKWRQSFLNSSPLF